MKTSYLKVFDRAGKNNKQSIADTRYNVSGIPTFYVVGKDGNIVHAGVGAGPRTKAGLEKALAQARLEL